MDQILATGAIFLSKSTQLLISINRHAEPQAAETAQPTPVGREKINWLDAATKTGRSAGG
jgi:hypothetical protein